MRAWKATAIVLGVSVILFGAACAQDEPVQELSDFFLPIGDPVAGRATFIEMGCNRCHLVPGDSGMPGLEEGLTKGPDIGAPQADETREWIANSIVSPSHEMPPLMREPESPMGDFRDGMTIRQLMDLVSFVTDAGQTQ